MPTIFDSITEGVSVPLTKLASGYTPRGLIGKTIFPVATSVTMTGKIPIWNKDAFKIYETLRARGAKSNRGTISGDNWVPFACEEHDLALPLDKRELDALNALPGDMQLKALFNLQNRQRRRVQWNMALEVEQKIATKVQTAANYGTNNKLALSTTTCWDQSGSTPIANIEAGREAIRSKIGVYPNTGIMGAATSSILKFHTDYTSKLRTTTDKIVNAEFIKETHELKNIYIGMSTTVDTEGNFVDLWGDNFILAYIPETETPDIEEPCWGYTVVPSFSPTPYPYVDVFTEEGGKIVNVRGTDMYDLPFIMADAAFLISNTKQ